MKQSLQCNERSFQDNERSFQDNERNDCLNNWTNILRQRMERSFQHNERSFQRTECFERNERSFQNNERSYCLQKGMEQNDGFNTTEWNRTIVLSQWNGTDGKSDCNWTENKRDLNGDGTAMTVPLHGIQMGTFIAAYCIWSTVHQLVQMKLRMEVLMFHLPRTRLKLTMASLVEENFIIKCKVYYSTVKHTGTSNTGVSFTGMSTLNTSTEWSSESIIPTSFSSFSNYYCKWMSLFFK